MEVTPGCAVITGARNFRIGETIANLSRSYANNRGGRSPAMTRLRDFSWWPNSWTNEAGASLTTAEIKQHGVLTNARRLFDGLSLTVDHNGVVYTAKITAHLSEDFLILLRHILLQHWGEPMKVVENFDIGFGHLT